MRSNREYDYFGNVLEYEYDYFPEYEYSYSKSTRTRVRVQVHDYDYSISGCNDNYYFLFIVLLCLMLYFCFLFDALTFIATQLYKIYAQCTYLCVDGSSCQLSICIWFSATNTFRSTSFSKQRISNPTFRNTQQSTCNKKSNIKKCFI